MTSAAIEFVCVKGTYLKRGVRLEVIYRGGYSECLAVTKASRGASQSMRKPPRFEVMAASRYDPLASWLLSRHRQRRKPLAWEAARGLLEGRGM